MEVTFFFDFLIFPKNKKIFILLCIQIFGNRNDILFHYLILAKLIEKCMRFDLE